MVELGFPVRQKMKSVIPDFKNIIEKLCNFHLGRKFQKLGFMEIQVSTEKNAELKKETFYGSVVGKNSRHRYQISYQIDTWIKLPIREEVRIQTICWHP